VGKEVVEGKKSRGQRIRREKNQERKKFRGEKPHAVSPTEDEGPS
jgi:hypothetical protein